jgi:hypothetical protein
VVFFDLGAVKALNALREVRVFWYWMHKNGNIKVFFASLKRHPGWWYTVWIPVEKELDEWVPQLIKMSPSFFGRKVIFETTKVEHILKNGGRRSYHWNGEGELSPTGDAIQGSWRSTIHTIQGFFHLSIVDPERLLAGQMSAANQSSAAYWAAPFVIARDIEELKIELENRGVAPPFIEKLADTLSKMARS